jgi:hypothetical protein
MRQTAKRLVNQVLRGMLCGKVMVCGQVEVYFKKTASALLVLAVTALERFRTWPMA